MLAKCHCTKRALTKCDEVPGRQSVSQSVNQLWHVVAAYIGSVEILDGQVMGMGPNN